MKLSLVLAGLLVGVSLFMGCGGSSGTSIAGGDAAGTNAGGSDAAGGGGGDSGNSGSSAGVGGVNSYDNTKGYVVDSPIQGMTYECGGKTGTTSATGEFECTTAPVVFKLGTFKVGELDVFTSDNKVFPQDILGLARSNFTDSSLIHLTRLLQSLDDDGNVSTSINLTANAATITANADWSIAGVALDYGLTVSEAEAMTHLRENIPAPSSNIVFNQALLDKRDSLQKSFYIVSCEDTGVNDVDGASYSYDTAFIDDNVPENSISLEGGKVSISNTLGYEVLSHDGAFSVIKHTYNGQLAGHSYWYYGSNNIKEGHKNFTDIQGKYPEYNHQISVLNDLFVPGGTCSATSWRTLIDL